MNYKQLLTLCTKAITENETGGNPDTPYMFSDPDGENSGKSGWSFGVSQFDTQNNFNALMCLNQCGFKMSEIIGIINQTIDVNALNFKLLTNKATVDGFDRAHISDSLEHVMEYCGPLLTPEATIHLTDYHNQFYMSPGRYMHEYLMGLGRMITPNDVLQYKTHTKWGRKRPDDVARRFNNIQDILKSS